ncbi:hypothetical protein [Desulforhabdus amnigena]|jgi:hypothetical protein|uniref:hypothetical protein n=1 Tax=Desulforhabdus amnigena TaxID=40218 RepID=UPI00249362CF|nr:hypothetical protein [Desulforhabdus amnigena]
MKNEKMEFWGCGLDPVLLAPPFSLLFLLTLLDGKILVAYFVRNLLFYLVPMSAEELSDFLVTQECSSSRPG